MIKKLLACLAAVALFAGPRVALADDNLWTPSCSYLPIADFRGSTTVVQCDQVTFEFRNDPQGREYIRVYEHGTYTYNVPFYSVTLSPDPTYTLIWVDSTARSVCGASFGSHVPFVQCSAG